MLIVGNKDVMLPGVVDAILGDLGVQSDSDPKWKGCASSVFIQESDLVVPQWGMGPSRSWDPSESILKAKPYLITNMLGMKLQMCSSWNPLLELAFPTQTLLLTMTIQEISLLPRMPMSSSSTS